MEQTSTQILTPTQLVQAQTRALDETCRLFEKYRVPIYAMQVRQLNEGVAHPYRGSNVPLLELVVITRERDLRCMARGEGFTVCGEQTSSLLDEYADTINIPRRVLDFVPTVMIMRSIDNYLLTIQAFPEARSV